MLCTTVIDMESNETDEEWIDEETLSVTDGKDEEEKVSANVATFEVEESEKGHSDPPTAEIRVNIGRSSRRGICRK